MSIILGIDEVGRGAWAGPLVVGAVVLGQAVIDGLDDSKKLSAKKRTFLAAEINQQARAVGIGWVSAEQLDEIGLPAALKLAAQRAVDQIGCQYDQIIIDGTVKLIDDDRVTTMPRADSLVAAVSAASIVAKVARDEYMAGLDQVYEGYNFASHVGYGTAAHRQAIERLGVLPIHRRSFAPVAQSIDYKDCPCKKLDKISNTIGRKAENVAAEYLIGKGHEILARNWKTKYCEIDIISKMNDILYFTEVKYRKNDRAGGGIEAITRKKENQMRFAARFYLETNRLDGKIDARLSAIAVAGTPPIVTNYIANIK
jgi:ribonuclease HII